MKAKCNMCGRKATKRLRIGLKQMAICSFCARMVMQVATKRGFKDMGGGVMAPDGAVVCTLARYGSIAKTEYASAAIHRGSDLIESEVYDTKELTDEEISERTLALAQKHGVSAVLALSEPVPVEFCEAGHLLIRIADGKGRTLPKTYKPFENN